MTEEQLAASNEPSFEGALKSKQEAEKHADQAPVDFRKQEQAVLKKAKTRRERRGGQGPARPARRARKALGGVQGGKAGAKTKDEEKRAKVATEHRGDLRAGARTRSRRSSTGLDGKVDARSTRASAARARRSRTTSSARWTRTRTSATAGSRARPRGSRTSSRACPPRSTPSSRGQGLYLARMDSVISHVADVVGGSSRRRRAASRRVRQESGEVRRGAPADLRKMGARPQEKISAKFDELESDVDSKQDELVQTLAQKYVESRDAVDKRIGEMKEANKGLVDKAKDAIAGVDRDDPEAEEHAARRPGRRRERDRQDHQDPIGFLKNLLEAIKAGLEQVRRQHRGAPEERALRLAVRRARRGGIQVPKSFDLKGIFTLVLEVLGLTWTAIRNRRQEGRRAGDAADGEDGRGLPEPRQRRPAGPLAHARRQGQSLRTRPRHDQGLGRDTDHQVRGHEAGRDVHARRAPSSRRHGDLQHGDVLHRARLAAR